MNRLIVSAVPAKPHAESPATVGDAAGELVAAGRHRRRTARWTRFRSGIASLAPPVGQVYCGFAGWRGGRAQHPQPVGEQSLEPGGGTGGLTGLARRAPGCCGDQGGGIVGPYESVANGGLARPVLCGGRGWMYVVRLCPADFLTDDQVAAYER
jgi:hypothetical protein